MAVILVFAHTDPDKGGCITYPVRFKPITATEQIGFLTVNSRTASKPVVTNIYCFSADMYAREHANEKANG